MLYRKKGMGSLENQLEISEQTKGKNSALVVAATCMISFMGVGLVDPILKTIAAQLDATPAQTTLLFTSYMLVTGVIMLFTGFLSSRIGLKKTLMAGLFIIVIFAGLGGLSNNINTLIGLRAGWGVGNALFVSTALATIVSILVGNTEKAIMMYVATLGCGMGSRFLSWWYFRKWFMALSILWSSNFDVFRIYCTSIFFYQEAEKPKTKVGFLEGVKSIKQP